MKKTKTKDSGIVSEMLNEYKFDYKKSKPNRFARTEKQLIVQLESDVAKIFDSSLKVNSALRAIISAYPGKTKKRLSI